MSLLVIAVLMAMSVAFTGMCSFNRGAPENGPVQKVDAQQMMQFEARAMNFPVRLPADPEGWTPNSARRSTVNGKPAPVVGWVTKNGAYLQLVQTDEPLEKALKNVDDNARSAEGTIEVDGQQFKKFTSQERNVRDVWAADLGDVRLIFSGTCSDEEFTQLAHNTLQAQPIPKP
ncbi:DUF4245 domain-containing protein [Corynebacterium epidermidicanis]|uniref:Putative DUF4245 family protein n=1 Tax=Corynebacterium epidermidicanis TaxID=1050174 RepID=A0A0G3GVB1_9CORY|nr:putative DUF4245 family protein [Corynebacterium epidermidicanis]